MAESMFAGQNDWELVGLSFVIAFFAAYVTIELGERWAGSPLHKKNFWIAGGAASIGAGLWGTNELGLLALHLETPFSGDRTFRAIAAVGCSLVALLLICWRPWQKRYLLSAGIVLSGCMSALLYTALEGLRQGTQAAQGVRVVALSLLITGGMCYSAFQLAYRFRNINSNTLQMKLAAGAFMGSALLAIQYAAMVAVHSHQHTFWPAATVAASHLWADKILTWVTLILLAVVGFIVLISEGTLMFLARRKVSRSEQERWQLMMSANRDGLFDFNLATGEVYYSPHWKEMIGYTADELENTVETWQERIHPDDRVKVDAAIEAYLRRQRGSSEMEYRLRHKNGSWRWVLARSQAVWNEKGEAVRLVGSHADITERNRAAEELSASQARFSAFMQHSPSIAYIKDADGRFVYTNATLERMWKLNANEWIGKSNEEIWPEAVAKQVAESDRDILSANVRSECVEEFAMPDGVVHQLLTSKFSFVDASGKRLLGGVSIDVTERLRSEEQWKASEARYRELFEHNPLPSWICRVRDLRILNVNQTAIDYYGWTRAQFLDLTMNSLLLSGEKQTPEEEKNAPVWHRRHQKSEILVELFVQEFEADGILLRLVMAKDVTDRVAFEKTASERHEQLEKLVALRAAELQTSEAKWRSLVEALPQIVWSAQPDGFCDYISQQLADYTGAPMAKLIGWGWRSFVHPGDREILRERWTAAASTGADYEVEYRIRSKQGQYRWFVTRGRLIASSGSAAEPHWLGTTLDIEDQKRSKEQLEAAVAERTLALAEARDRAESEAKAKIQFLDAMGQEIRSPLSGVIGMTSMLLNTPLSSKQRSYVDTVQSCGEALSDVVNDVLDFSKIEAGRMELEKAEFVLETLLEESMELIATAAAAKGIQLHLHVGGDIPFNVIGDAKRVKQILLNLVSNAVKFTSQGTVDVSVTQEQADAQDELVTLNFSVRDTGVGLTAEEQVVLFLPFVEANRATNRPIGGTGLGLSIAKRLVELMGGTIGAESERGQGSRFWFQLRLKPGSSIRPPEFQVASGGRILLLTSGNDALTLPGASSVWPYMVQHYLERAGLAVKALHWPDQRVEDEEAAAAATLVIVDAALLAANADHAGERRMPGLGRYPLLILGSPTECPHLGLALPHLVEFLPKPIRCLPLLNAVRDLLSRNPKAGSVADEPEQQERREAQVLLAEDNQINQLITKLFLAKLGCQVSVASNGIEACAAVENRMFDLILMDCQMPVMDGFEATQNIRKKEKGHRTPIIGLSAGVLKEERERCYAAGMDDFLSKPLEKQELETALQNWLAGRTNAAQTLT